MEVLVLLVCAPSSFVVKGQATQTPLVSELGVVVRYRCMNATAANKNRGSLRLMENSGLQMNVDLITNSSNNFHGGT